MLVTGAGGLIGSHQVEALARNGRQPRVPLAESLSRILDLRRGIS